MPFLLTNGTELVSRECDHQTILFFSASKTTLKTWILERLSQTQPHGAHRQSRGEYGVRKIDVILSPRQYPGTSMVPRGKYRKVMGSVRSWWVGELQRSRSFLETDKWSSGKLGKARLTLREVLAMSDLVRS